MRTFPLRTEAGARRSRSPRERRDSYLSLSDRSCPSPLLPAALSLLSFLSLSFRSRSFLSLSLSALLAAAAELTLLEGDRLRSTLSLLELNDLSTFFLAPGRSTSYRARPVEDDPLAFSILPRDALLRSFMDLGWWWLLDDLAV